MSDLNYERVATAINYLSQNFKKQPELEEVAQQVHLSPHHFQRIFKEWAGVSPKQFMQYLSLEYLREKIFDTSNIIQAADAVGYTAQSRVYDLFVTIEAVTPNEYKRLGKGLLIQYGFHQTPFGECLIGITSKGICALSFIDVTNKQQELDCFFDKWSLANLEFAPENTQKVVDQIFSQNNNNKARLLVKGTNFQLKVWEALIKIPNGSVATYQSIANAIQNPKAVRAVGTAIGNNPIAFLIPCHRVIRKDGQIGEYHWGRTRKKALIGYEMASQN